MIPYSYLLVSLQFFLIGVILSVTAFSFVWRPSGAVLFLMGVVVGIAALMRNRLGNFNIVPDLKEGCSLVTNGIYAYIRHPMYTSVILMSLGVSLLSRFYTVLLIVCALLLFVLFLKAKREESLWCSHDRRYEAYRRKTRYFIPYIL